MKKSLLLILVSICVCVGSMIVSLSHQRDAKAQSKRAREETRRQMESHARSVYRGVLDPSLKKIPDVITSEDRDVRSISDICQGLTLTPYKAPPTGQEILNDRACDVAAVIIGTVKAQTSRLTEDETSIYTINEMDVTAVIKDNLAQSIKTGDHINVLRYGGRIEIKGRKAEALSYASLWLEMDRTYLLFLSFVPEKGFYVANSISHELKDNKIVLLSKRPAARDLETGRDAESFIASVRAAVAAPCDD
jgi:hypothetical protein